jgi:hypothetical protein
MTAVLPDIATFRAACHDWLATQLKPRSAISSTRP